MLRNINPAQWKKTHLTDVNLKTKNKTLLCFDSAAKINAIKILFRNSFRGLARFPLIV